MTRPAFTYMLALLLFGTAAVVAGCAQRSDGTLATTGSIADERTVLAVPRLGAEPTATPDPGWSRVTSVAVEVGDAVNAGDVLATVDDGVVASGIALAEAQLVEAEAQRRLLSERREDIVERQRDVAENRDDIERVLDDLRAQRTEVAGQLAQARRLVEQMPPGGMPPGAVPPGAAPPGGGQDPRAIVAQLEAALARIDAGIAQAEEGLQRLDDASSELSDATQVLDAGAEAAAAAVQARQAGVRLAQARAALATVRAPRAGVVTAVPVLGQVLAAGAPLAEIRPHGGDIEVVTYLTAAQVRLIDAGDRAEVRIDSRPNERFEAEVARVGTEYAYVPSRFSTREIHLLRAFEVRLRLTQETGPPPGMPADVTLYPR